MCSRRKSKAGSRVAEQGAEERHGWPRDIATCRLVTIDGETARDFDDQCIANRSPQRLPPDLAIADVSHYVKPNDALDTEGYERGNSVYFPRRVIPCCPGAVQRPVFAESEVDRCRWCATCRSAAPAASRKYRF